jgi:hypothetical protein
MKAEWYRRVCEEIDQVCPLGRRPRERFSDGDILKVYFWSVGWKKPVSWACRKDNWTEEFFPGSSPDGLPSQSWVSRRLRTIPCIQAMERLNRMLAERFGQGIVKAMDSRPLKVGSYSKDREARRGRAAGEMARGYKLHGILSSASSKGVLWPWVLTGMQTNDQVPAKWLLEAQGKIEADGKGRGWGYLVADNLFDANPMHVAAREINRQFVAPPRRSNQGVRDQRRNTPERLRALDMTDDLLERRGVGTGFGAELMDNRRSIEQCFGHQTMLGLTNPPPWVRRPRRMAMWVGAMLVVQMLRKLEIKELQR